MARPEDAAGGRGSCQEADGPYMTEGRAHVRGTQKFLEFCTKRNRESQSPPKCFTSSEDGNCEAITGSNLFYHCDLNLVFDLVLKGEEESV